MRYETANWTFIFAPEAKCHFSCMMMNEAMQQAMQPLNQVINAAAKASRMRRDLKHMTFWHCQIAGAKSLDRTKNQY